MAQATIGAGASQVTVYTVAGSFSPSAPLGQAATCSFDIIDAAGQYEFKKGMPVTVVNAVDPSILCFEGFVDVAKMAPYGYSPGRKHSISCVDNTYLAQKRIIGAAYSNLLAGDIASDIVDSILFEEGVVGQHATDRSTNQADFNKGTLTNWIAFPDSDDGHAEIARGYSIYRSENTLADWQNGTLNSLVASVDANTQAASIAMATEAAIQFVYTASSTGTSYLYQYFNGDFTYPIVSGDKLVYDLWVDPSSPLPSFGIDGIYNSGASNLRINTSLLDQNKVRLHPDGLGESPITTYAVGKWYHRIIDLSALAGQVITNFLLGCDGDIAGTYTAYFKNIYILDGSGNIKVTIFATGASFVNGAIQAQSINTTANANPVTVRVPDQRISPDLNLNSALVVGSSSITWTATQANGTDSTLTIEASIDSGATWVICTQGGAVPGLIPGKPISSSSLRLRQTFGAGSNGTTGADPSTCGDWTLTALSVSVSYAAQTKNTNTLKTYATTSDFSGGTLTHVAAASNAQALSGYRVSAWETGTTDNQTQWSAGTSPSTAIMDAECQLTVTNGSIVSQLGNIASQSSFTADVTIVCPAAGSQMGIVYCTTNWSATNNTFGYFVGLSTTQLVFGYGTNSGTSTFTSLTSPTISLTAGQSYAVRIQFNASTHTHTFWIQGTQYGPYTDSTYSSGGIGVRFYNTTAGALTGQLGALGLVSYSVGGSGAATGTWVTAAYAPGNLYYGASDVRWADTLPTAACSLSVDVSTNNGTTWTTGVVNGNALPGLSSGADISSDQILIRVNYSTTNCYYSPQLTGVAIDIVPQFFAGGGRTHNPLQLSSVTEAGSGPVVWDATTPTNSAVTVMTTLNAPDPATSLAAWTTSGTVAISNTQFPATSASSYAVGTSGYAYSTAFKVVDGQALDYDVYIDSTAGANAYSDLLFMTTSVFASSTGQAFHLDARAGKQSGFGAVSSSYTVAALSGASHFFAAANTWYHVTLVFAAGAVTAYVNYQQVAGPYTYNHAGDTIVMSAQSASTRTYYANFQVSNIMTNGGVIAGINYADATVLDSFAADSSAHYTSENAPGGTLATWTWDVTNGRLISLGGTYAILKYNTSIGSNDMLLVADFDYADGGGFVGRMTDTSNYYELVLHDNSSDQAPANTVQLYKWVTGTRNLIWSSSQQLWTRGSLVRTQWTIQGSQHTIVFNGVTLTTLTDTSLATGEFAGIRNGASGNDTSQIYNFNVQPIGQNASALTAYTREFLTTSDPTVIPVLDDITVSVRSWYIQDGPSITSAVFAYSTVADALNELATKSGFYWKIDSNKRLIFMPRTAVLAPWIANGETMIFSTIVVESSAPLYRNTEYITNITAQTDEQFEQFIGDGTSRSFTLGYAISTVPTLELNGILQTVGIKGIESGKQWYWAKGDPVLAQDSSSTVLSKTDTLDVNYFGEYPSIITSSDQNGVTDRQTIEGGGSGKVEVVDSEPNDLTTDAALESASYLLSTYGVIGRTLTFQTKKSGLVVGTLLTIDYPALDLNKVDFLISKADPIEGPGGVPYWDVEAIEGPVTGDWVAAFERFFQQIPTSIQLVNTGSSQVLNSVETITESTPWTESLSQSVNNVNLPNTTLYPSTGLYPA